MQKSINGPKNGGTRIITKSPSYYPAEDTPLPKKSRKSPRPAKLRSSIQPGTILIILSGRYKGKRVVFIKQLESGLLLVSGPFKVNGVPLRRVNQAYVIATKSRVEVSASVAGDITDKFFAKDDKKVRAETQKVVGKSILESVKKVAGVKEYLGARFSLKKGQYPHLMQF